MGVEGPVELARFLNDNLFLRLRVSSLQNLETTEKKEKGLGSVPLIQAAHRIRLFGFLFLNVPLHSRDSKTKRQIPKAIFKLKDFHGDNLFL